jgi:HPt (histidine-containing phosphotransfer) domain-containing protein
MNSNSPYEHSVNGRVSACQSDWAPPALLLEVASGDEDLIRDVVAEFERDTETRLENARNALAAGNQAKIRAEAHAIKGGARQVGAMVVGDTCQIIELSALDASPYELADRLTQLEEEFRQTCAAMKNYFRC